MIHQFLVSIRKPFLKMVPVPKPKCIVGANSIASIHQLCQDFTINHALVVCDPNVYKLGLLNPMLGPFAKAKIRFSVFNQVEPDPGFDIIRAGVEQYKLNQCDGIIAFGGGSALDCAKAVGASVRTGKDVKRLTGMLRVRRPLMPIIAVPTTAGTGSECTVAAVVSDKITHTKQAITDPFLVPKVAVIDPLVMLGLPPQVTAETGIDALTHAIESYLSQYANQYTRELSIDAINLIFANLETAVNNGFCVTSREKMAYASYQAGLAFTRTYIGYVHAIAHQLGAVYHIPHGRANAMVLVPILKFYQNNNCKPLQNLASTLGFSDSSQLISKVDTLLRSVAIPTYIKELKETDVEHIAKSAIREAFGEYPVPIVMNSKQCAQILRSLINTNKTKDHERTEPVIS